MWNGRISIRSHEVAPWLTATKCFTIGKLAFFTSLISNRFTLLDALHNVTFIDMWYDDGVHGTFVSTKKL